MYNFCKAAVSIFLLTTLIASCKKDDSLKVVHGNITLKVLVKHHDWTIHNIRVYLKSNATVWPGRDSTLYDTMTETAQDGTCEFDNLYVGNYVVYASGYDPVVYTNVIGYMPLQISNAGLTNNTLAITMYVSE